LARSLAAYGRYLSASAEGKGTRRGALLLAEARTLFEQMGMAGDLIDLNRDAGPTQPHRISTRLPLASAPTGRPLATDEWVEVTWTLAAPEDDARPGKVARRQHRLLRLLSEASAQGAAPTVTDLAQALGVSRATIKRDLAALRRAGQAARTRGGRGSSRGAS
jgi:DNA-binding transcriptional ArsR family regulator